MEILLLYHYSSKKWLLHIESRRTNFVMSTHLGKEAEGLNRAFPPKWMTHTEFINKAS